MVAEIIHAYRVLNADYRSFDDRGPATSLRDLAGATLPFDRYEAVKSALTACFPGIAWQDARQVGLLEGETGRIEFNCDDLALEGGYFSAITPDSQDVSATHLLLGRLSGATGLAILDEETMELIPPIEHRVVDRGFRIQKPPPAIEVTIGEQFPLEEAFVHFCESTSAGADPRIVLLHPTEREYRSLERRLRRLESEGKLAFAILTG